MTAPSLTFVGAVRDFLELEPNSTSRYTDETIGSNIRTATWFLERATGRLFSDRTKAMTFSTNGAPHMTIPGLRTATSVTLGGSALTADSTYWLVPDSQQTGVFTGIALRAFTRTDGPWYMGVADWWDRGLDMPNGPRTGNTMPNDLVITGSWGYADADVPEPVRFATKVLAAFWTKYPDAVLIGSAATAGGGAIDLSGFPLPVQQFITDWRVEAGVAQA